MKLIKKLAASVACFFAAAALAGCGVVEKGAGYAGYHKVAEPEVLVNGEVLENSADYVEVKFYDGKDNDPINAGKTYVRAGKDVVITVGLAEGFELDGEITCDIKTVKLVLPEEKKESEGENSEAAASSEETTSEKDPDATPSEALRAAKTSEEVEEEALPVAVSYVFEMPDASPTFTIKVKGEAPHVHSYGEAWEKNEDGHYHVCECGAKTVAEAHIWDEGTVTVEATAEANGSKVFKCTVCGFEKTVAVEYVAPADPEVPEAE